MTNECEFTPHWLYFSQNMTATYKNLEKLFMVVWEWQCQNDNWDIRTQLVCYNLKSVFKKNDSDYACQAQKWEQWNTKIYKLETIHVACQLIQIQVIPTSAPAKFLLHVHVDLYNSIQLWTVHTALALRIPPHSELTWFTVSCPIGTEASYISLALIAREGTLYLHGFA